MKVTAWVVTAAAVLVTAGCSGADEATSPASPASLTVNGMDLEPELDEATGAVILPVDRFQPTWEERDILATASSVSVALCAREHGVSFFAPELSSDPVYLSEDYFGPWTVGQAERFAFVTPMTDADLEANGITGGTAESGSGPDTASHPNFSLSDEDWATIDECASSNVGDRFKNAAGDIGPWDEQIDAARDALLDSDEAQELLDELGACFTSQGMQPDPETPWLVHGANGREISEQQVQLALKVVACKKDTGFTEGMALLEARATIPAIAEYADELVEQRRVIDDAVEDARALIGAHDDVVYHEP